MSLTLILNIGILLVFLCGAVAGWCVHQIRNNRRKKSFFIFASLFALAFTPAPSHAQKSWKLISPGPCEGGGGSGGSDVSGFPAATTLGPSCASLSIGGTCTDSEGTQLFYVGLMDGKRIYGMMADISEGSAYKSENTAGGGPSVNNGMVNTSVMTLPTTLMYYPAAVACKAFGISYYLPSKDELNLIWTNRTAINLASKGFEVSGSWYWTSSEDSAPRAWVQRLNDGLQYGSSSSVGNKNNNNRVRCIRH